GTTTISPTIIYYKDTQLVVLNSYPLPNVTFQDSLIYYLPPLEPYNDTTIIIEFIPNSNLKPAYIKLKARIEPIANDNNPSDNFSEWIFSEASINYGNFAHSPTKILVDQLNPTPPFIDYVVYFKTKYHRNQFYFSIQNVMAGNLAQHTFELVGSSNPVNIDFNKEGKKIFIEMPHCNLIKSKFSGPRNYAWVHYRVKPKKTLKSGDVITNVINSNTENYDFYDANTFIVSPPDYFATAIQGDTTACIDTGLVHNYATPLHTGNIYNWTVPNYGSIISGQGTHAIDVKWMATGAKYVAVVEKDSAMIFVDYDSVKVTTNPTYSKVNIVYLWPGDSVFLAGMWQHTPGTYV
ncbi:MAG TPA: hypothetical protein PLO59_11350, partial [Bacteroidia bacterium]|nr:hypothetical protein [Bacteroidia bacterium]